MLGASSLCSSICAGAGVSGHVCVCVFACSQGIGGELSDTGTGTSKTKTPITSTLTNVEFCRL